MSKEDLVKERILRGIAREADSAAPGLADTEEGVPRELIALKSAARYFYDLLDQSLEKNRAELLRLPRLAPLRAHPSRAEYRDRPRHLHQQCAGQRQRRAPGRERGAGIRPLRMEEDYRRLMLQDVRNLQCLKKLSGFLFDRLINGLQPSQSGRKELSFYTAADQLEQLATISWPLSPPRPSSWRPYSPSTWATK